MAKVEVKPVNRRDYDSEESYKEARITNLDKALKELRKKSINENIMKITRDKMYYKSKSEIRKEKKKAGRRKQLRKMRKDKMYARD